MSNIDKQALREAAEKARSPLQRLFRSVMGSAPARHRAFLVSGNLLVPS